jgi:secondary thiamine-phosphate synthase enzyme
MWLHKEITLPAKSRGFHLVTEELLMQLPEINSIETGIAHFFIKHTSASLSVNENADPTVRSDLEAHLGKLVPENAPYYEHILEGADDMPAHIKSALIGSSITLPIHRGKLCLGVWQGIYLGEHRNRGGSRHVVVTLHGQTGAN